MADQSPIPADKTASNPAGDKAAPPAEPVMLSVRVAPGRVVHTARGVAPARPGALIELPPAEASRLLTLGHVVSPDQPLPIATAPGAVDGHGAKTIMHEA